MKLTHIMASVASLALVAVSSAGAQATPTPTVLYACYVPSSGTVYRISPDESIPDLKTDCTGKSHVKFSWNEQGARGPQGPKGDAGPQGPPGPSGQGGTPVRVTKPFTFTGSGHYSAVIITCPAGKKVSSGGFLIPFTVEDGTFMNSVYQGMASDDFSSWIVPIKDSPGSGATGSTQNLFAICS